MSCLWRRRQRQKSWTSIRRRQLQSRHRGLCKMTLSTEEIQELAQILDARAGHGRSERPKLRLITPPTPQLLDSIARESHLRRIGHLRRRYRLDWLVDQASFSVASVTLLEDCDLIRLLLDMERARECI